MKEKIFELRKLGKTYDEISLEVGCSKSTVSYYCSPNEKENSRLRTNKKRKEFRIELKRKFGGKCSICGYNKCLTSLVFHHKDPNIKEKNVCALINSKGKSWAYNEAKKCILICSNCHGEIHDKLNNR